MHNVSQMCAHVRARAPVKTSRQQHALTYSLIIQSTHHTNTHIRFVPSWSRAQSFSHSFSHTRAHRERAIISRKRTFHIHASIHIFTHTLTLARHTPTHTTRTNVKTPTPDTHIHTHPQQHAHTHIYNTHTHSRHTPTPSLITHARAHTHTQRTPTHPHPHASTHNQHTGSAKKLGYPNAQLPLGWGDHLTQMYSPHAHTCTHVHTRTYTHAYMHNAHIGYGRWVEIAIWSVKTHESSLLVAFWHV